MQKKQNVLQRKIRAQNNDKNKTNQEKQILTFREELEILDK